MRRTQSVFPREGVFLMTVEAQGPAPLQNFYQSIGLSLRQQIIELLTSLQQLRCQLRRFLEMNVPL